MSVHEPVNAASWIENNWDGRLLTSIRGSGCGGPFAWMLSPEEPALAIFGYYNEPVVVNMAQSLAESSGFPVVIQPSHSNPALTLLAQSTVASDGSPQDADGNGDGGSGGGASGNSGNGGGQNGGAQDNGNGNGVGGGSEGGNNQPHGAGGAGGNGGGGPNGAGGAGGGHDGGPNGAGGADAGPTMVDDKWESALHRTRIELRLKLNTGHTYAVNFGYNFKVESCRDFFLSTHFS
ncbi:hypothetical protein B0H16DRAFT_156411 [Mycena metata]|uniref:Uncharacterized protein n=1 Tax=Mycena metata TaxID=1033252 RepID=A0AAD7I4U6_9AGAR|nr:hypothetical protein B0H16DRAFT_156411 [Mycena metata]